MEILGLVIIKYSEVFNRDPESVGEWKNLLCNSISGIPVLLANKAGKTPLDVIPPANVGYQARRNILAPPIVTNNIIEVLNLAE